VCRLTRCVRIDIENNNFVHNYNDYFDHHQLPHPVVILIMQNALKLYLAWLVPSTLSFISSMCVLYYVLIHKPALRAQLFHQLSVMLAVADLIQSGNWFAGVKYSAPYGTCAVMEYFMQTGTLLKAFTTISKWRASKCFHV
jgi:hypothetical protein